MRSLAAGALALLAGGCLKADVTVCKNGALCPSGFSCTEQDSLCGETLRVEACAGKSQFDSCEYHVSGEPAVGAGTCHAGICDLCTPELAGCFNNGFERMTADTSETLNAVWVGGIAEAFAVGANGVAVRYDGFSWQHDTALESLAHEKLVSVVGFSSPLELFVLGVDGQVFHFRDSWSAIPSGSMFPLVALTGVARDNVIGVGINEVWRLNGTTWTQIPNPSGPAVNFHGVWAASATDIYAVGEADLAQGMSATDGIVRRYDGSSWSTPHFIADTPLWGVGGASASDVYVAGPLTGTTSTAHFNGAWVTLMDASTMGANGTAVWASAPDDTFIAGQNGIFHFMGMWSKPSTAPMTAIHGSSRQNVIAVGPAGTIWRYAPR